MIPPNAGLTFEVELTNIEDGEVPPNVFKEIDTNEDKMLSQDEVSILIHMLLLLKLIFVAHSCVAHQIFPFLAYHLLCTCASVISSNLL